MIHNDLPYILCATWHIDDNKRNITHLIGFAGKNYRKPGFFTMTCGGFLFLFSVNQSNDLPASTADLKANVAPTVRPSLPKGNETDF
jgi:hypothetical protein